MDSRERLEWFPAARCRGCGVVTWQVSIARGLDRVPDAEHAVGCTQPPGRIDMRYRQDMRTRKRFERPMSDAALAEAAEDHARRRRGSRAQ